MEEKHRKSEGLNFRGKELSERAWNKGIGRGTTTKLVFLGPFWNQGIQNRGIGKKCRNMIE